MSEIIEQQGGEGPTGAAARAETAAAPAPPAPSGGGGAFKVRGGCAAACWAAERRSVAAAACWAAERRSVAAAAWLRSRAPQRCQCALRLPATRPAHPVPAAQSLSKTAVGVAGTVALGMAAAGMMSALAIGEGAGRRMHGWPAPPS